MKSEVASSTVGTYQPNSILLACPCPSRETHARASTTSIYFRSHIVYLKRRQCHLCGAGPMPKCAQIALLRVRKLRRVRSCYKGDATNKKQTVQMVKNA